MAIATGLKRISVHEADAYVRAGAAYIDLRKVRDYLDVHIPRSLCLQFESGPGLNSRARDCIPLEVQLVLLEEPDLDMNYITAALRGKGFAVLGVLAGGIRAWSEVKGAPISTEVADTAQPPEGHVLDVGDPGAPRTDGAVRIPIEKLWTRAEELGGRGRVVIASGKGVRAALAVGMLERAGIDDIVFWRPRV